MNRPTELQRKAIRRLSSTDDFMIFLSWLEDTQEQVDKDLRRVPIERFQNFQGQALVLENIIKYGSRKKAPQGE